METYSAQSKVAPLPFPAAGSPSDPVFNELLNKKVVLRGSYDLERQMVVINRENKDGPGFWLLAPFKVAGADYSVIVSRGFIPFEEDSAQKWKKFDQPGEIEIQAVAQASVGQRFSFGPANPDTGPGLPFQTRWLFPQIDKIARQIPYPVISNLYLQQLGGGPANGFPEEDIRIEVPPSVHFGYTFEWILLAFATAFFAFMIQAFPHIFTRRGQKRSAYLPPRQSGSTPASTAVLAGLLILFSPLASSATTDPARVPEQAQINEKFGETVDKEIKLRDSDGKSVTLGELMINNRPLVLVPVYFHCPNLCGYLQRGLVEAINKTDLMLGTDYSVVSFSIDPEEDPANAGTRREEFTGLLSGASDRSKEAWRFVTGDRENITKLVRQIGFKYEADDKEFVHSAILVVLAPDGKISRYLYGIKFEPKDFKMSLVEASAGKIGSFVDRILMFCFHFDDNRGKYTLAIMNLVRILSIAVVLALAGTLVYMKKSERSGL